MLMSTKTSLREHVLWEIHVRGWGGPFGRDKILSIVKDWFYWPGTKLEIAKLLQKCWICQTSKTQKNNTDFYTPLPIPHELWQDLSMDFVLDLPKTLWIVDSIFIVVGGFFKVAHFLPCNKTHDTLKIISQFFKEIVRLHGIPKTIISDCDVQIHKLLLAISLEVYEDQSPVF